MDMRYMSSTALQMKINELMRENDDLKRKIEEKDTKINELTDALQNKENKIERDAEMETLAYAVENLKTVSRGAIRDAVGAEQYDRMMLSKEREKEENKSEFNWDILIPIGCVAFALVMLIVGECFGMM